MIDYRIWKTPDDDLTILVEFWDQSRIMIIQKEFIEKGYYVDSVEFNIFGYHFIKFKKLEE